jgi:hypothetical protein
MSTDIPLTRKYSPIKDHLKPQVKNDQAITAIHSQNTNTGKAHEILLSFYPKNITLLTTTLLMISTCLTHTTYNTIVRQKLTTPLLSPSYNTEAWFKNISTILILQNYLYRHLLTSLLKTPYKTPTTIKVTVVR